MGGKRAGRVVTVVSLGAACVLLGACASLWDLGGGSRRGASSSLVDFLYPNGEEPPGLADAVPRLRLPLKVGLAFVPGGQFQTEGLTEAHKQQLLESVRSAFNDRDFIADIQVIPDTYLRARGGFETLDQIARMYGVDVMALVSYDQMGFAGDSWKSFAYWTIVGMYVIKGSEHEVQTFVDTAVFDVPSRKLLFRAPGQSRIEGEATAVAHAEATRRAREAGFDQAVERMIPNLARELDAFRQRVEAGQTNVEVSRREGYSGSGRVDGTLLALLALLACATAWRRAA